MAKKNLDKALDKEKLDLGRTLYALDMRDKNYYNNLSDELKKKYSPLVLMRFFSSAPNQDGQHEYHVTFTNELVNENFWTLSKYPDLQHLLLSICGLGKKNYHSWIPMAKRNNDNKLFEFLKLDRPNINDIEFNIFIKTSTEQDFVDMAKGRALDDKEIQTLLEQFRNAKK